MDAAPFGVALKPTSIEIVVAVSNRQIYSGLRSREGRENKNFHLKKAIDTYHNRQEINKTVEYGKQKVKVV